MAKELTGLEHAATKTAHAAGVAEALDRVVGELRKAAADAYLSHQEEAAHVLRDLYFRFDQERKDWQRALDADALEHHRGV